MKFSYEQLINITNAKPILNKGTTGIFDICTDTRTISKGQIYLPLKGENFDGELFIEMAVKNGAIGYFTTNPNNISNETNFALLVNDTKIAYLQLANFYKRQINPTTIAITGSSGKTTTKEIFNAIFKENRRTHKSLLNHNNEIGLCQTLLNMPEDTEVLIVEMGMRGFGEIDLLSMYAQPDIAVITNIGTAHIGRLKSRENIAKAKCEIIKHLSENGVLITGTDELYNKTLKGYNVKHIVSDTNLPTFSLVEMTKEFSKFKYKNYEYIIPAGGEYNVKDTLLAIEAALLYGLKPKEIQKGLSTYKTIENRFEQIEINKLQFINDSYNANPDSMKAAIKSFIELYDGNKVLVLADMGELGENSVFFHEEIGLFLNKFENINLLTVGPLAKNIAKTCKHKSYSFDSNKEVIRHLMQLADGTKVLLKGSRAMKLDEIIKEMQK